MLIIQRKKCQGCAALNGGKADYTCKLGYKVSFKTMTGVRSNLIPIQPVPEEPCPKPKTVKDYTDYKKELK